MNVFFLIKVIILYNDVGIIMPTLAAVLLGPQKRTTLTFMHKNTDYVEYKAVSTT